MKTLASFITVLFLSILFMAAENPRVITGTVVDENGYDLIGVTVPKRVLRTERSPTGTANTRSRLATYHRHWFSLI